MPDSQGGPLRNRVRQAACGLNRALAVPARGLVQIYRYTLSPLIGFHCRHLPTCSDYSDQAFRRFGFWPGGWMTLGRLCRCQPFGTSGLDFIPAALPDRARWWLPWRYARWRSTNATPPDQQTPAGDPSLTR